MESAFLITEGYQTTLIDKEYGRHSFLTLNSYSNIYYIGIYFHQNYWLKLIKCTEQRSRISGAGDDESIKESTLVGGANKSQIGIHET